jgi:DNA replication protein DnaC
MEFNKIAYEKAERELLRRKIKAEESAKLHFEQVAAISPEFVQIDNTMKSQIKKLTMMIFQKNQDASLNIERIKSEYQYADSIKKKIISENGFADDYISVKYNCGICNDTGFVDGKRCSCFLHLINEFAIDELNKYANLPNCDFKHFNLSYYSGTTKEGNDIHGIMANNYKSAKKYADNFTQNCESLLLYGNTGLGKTHLSLAIAKRVIEKGYSVAYNSIINYLNEISKEKYGRSADPSADTERELIKVDLLVIDDLGSEHNTSFFESIIYNIINTRMNLSKPTIINCNLEKFDDLRAIYDDRLVSRIGAYYKRLQFVGSDIRQIKRKL